MNENFDSAQVAGFVKLMRQIAEDVFDKKQTGIEKYYNGIVISVSEDNETATVDIGDKTLNDIPNKTGVVLSADKAVRVYSGSSSLTDAYIGILLG